MAVGVALLAAPVDAVGAPYRAGHHHAGFGWSTIDTRFFRIHYATATGPRASDAGRTAREVARVADDLLIELANAAGWIAHGPIHVVVSDEAEGMTAYSLPSWGWIVLSPDPGPEVFRLRGRQDWVTDALAHELGHLVGHRLAGALPPSASYGIALSSAIDGPVGVGSTVQLAPNEPYGWSEGAAEAWSAAIGVNRWTAGRAATLRTAALADRLVTFDEWWVSADKDDVLDAERVYQQGYAFARWLSDAYAVDVFAEMGAEAHRRYTPSWPALLARVTGEPARVVWARWRASVVAEAEADEARLRARGIAAGVELERTVTPLDDLDAVDRWASRPARAREESDEQTGVFELYPRTSPDGRWVAEGKIGWIKVWRGAASDRPGGTAATADRERRADATTAWIPARFGTAFAFVPGQDALVVVAPEDARLPRIARGVRRDPWGELVVVDLAPDLVPVRHRGGTATVETLSLATARDRRRRMSPIPGTLRARDPAVSPDGTQVAWLAYADGTTNLRVGALDGTGARALSAFDDGAWLEHPSWSPDGRSIVVSMLRGGRADLWTVDVATGAWTARTDDPADQIDPVWAADGIWYSADSDGVFDVYRLDPATGATTRMTRVLGGAITPWPLPDGGLLYAAHTASGFKSMRVDPTEVLDEPAPPGVSGSAIAPPPSFTPEVRRYAPLRSLLVPAVGPIVRLDGGPDGVRPLGGAYVHLRDAVEQVDLGVYGLVGDGWLGDAALTVRALAPELTLWASGSGDGPTGQTAGAAGGTVGVRVRDDVTVELGGQWWA
ncbi:MAG: hypothetical protein ABMB14_36335, partial [Myxococcota bacterium]